MYMNSLRTNFLNVVHVIWWISVWGIFDYMINQIVDDQYRLFVYFAFALITFYIIQVNNIPLK